MPALFQWRHPFFGQFSFGGDQCIGNEGLRRDAPFLKQLCKLLTAANIPAFVVEPCEAHFFQKIDTRWPAQCFEKMKE